MGMLGNNVSDEQLDERRMSGTSVVCVDGRELLTEPRILVRR